jgi:precorrin-6Y C5,15-methyltransferase (decarboxylating)
MTPWLAIIGIGEDGLAGLGGAARALVDSAELLVGGARHLAMVPEAPAQRLAWASPLNATIPRIAEWRGRRVVVLASGDPMCYGVGTTLAQHFERAEMTILPHLSAFTLAAACLAWPLPDCTCLSVHGRPLDAVRLHLAPGQRILILSEDGTTPARLAALLRELGWGQSRLVVLEHLGGARERMIDASADAWSAERCADLNTIAIDCVAGAAARIFSRLGLPDDAFLSDGQLTKRETRAATIAALAPLPGELLWDVGAGSGSVAIEFLRAAPRTRAIAIERSPARCDLIARNAAALGVPDLRIVMGAAPTVLDDLPPPDAIFLGGGIATPGLIERLWAVLPARGRLVANAVTLAGEARLLAWHAEHGGELVRIAVSRAAPVGKQIGWRPLMPVTQLVAVKPT